MSLKKGKKPDFLENQTYAVNTIQTCIMNVSSWMSKMKLKLNEEKTDFIIVGLRQQLSKMAVDHIKLGDTKIKSAKSVCNLGVYFDENMSMKCQVNHICTVCYMQIRNIRYIRSYRLTHVNH